MRKERSIKNIFTAIFGQLIMFVFPFITRSIFIRYLSIEYLGINGLFSNILSILSISELGISSAIVFSLYKPLAEKNDIQIKRLINFYSRIYKKIAIFVLSVGLLIIPFLPIIIKGVTLTKEIYIIYLLFLLNSFLSYLVVYKRSILIADQKIYISNSYHIMAVTATNIFQMVVLILSSNFILYISIKVLFDVIQNILIYRKAESMYPVVRDIKGYDIDRKTKKDIYKKVKALLMHKIGDTVLNSTDNIVMSAFLGVSYVGIYSNYYIIIKMLNSLIAQMFYAVTASIGNLNAIKVTDKSYMIYKSIYFANFWIFGFASTGLFVIFENFIDLWIGKDYLLGSGTLILIVMNFYIIGMRRVNLIFRDSLGLYWNDRFKPIVESLINLTISLLLVKKFAINGILIGTLTSVLLTSFWIEPYILFKNGFERSTLSYFVSYFKYSFATVLAISVTKLISSNWPDYTITNLFIKFMIVFIIPNSIFLIMFHNSDEFKYFKDVFHKMDFKKMMKG